MSPFVYRAPTVYVKLQSLSSCPVCYIGSMLYAVGTHIDLGYLNFAGRPATSKKKTESHFFEVGTQFRFKPGIKIARQIPVAFA